MKTYNHLYDQIISLENLIIAWQKARKRKTKKIYVIEFEQNLFCNLMALHYELRYRSYKPKPLKAFVVRDPKTRKIHKSEFRDRIVHHAVVNVLEPLFERRFIYDSWANRIGKGNVRALARFDSFARKVSRNNASSGWFTDTHIQGYCLKADIKQYFREVDHAVLMEILKRKIKDPDVLWLIEQILKRTSGTRERERERLTPKGMPLGNLTSQFFGNVYLNELDYFIKHVLRAKYYIRYVDDFVVLHTSKQQLEVWKEHINDFLQNRLKIELHPQKSRVIPLSHSVDFVGFRWHYNYRLLRKRNIRKMRRTITAFENDAFTYRQLMHSYAGWQGYALWAHTYKLRKKLLKRIARAKYLKIEQRKEKGAHCSLERYL